VGANKQASFRAIEGLLYKYKTFGAAIRALEAEKKSLAGPYSDNCMPQATSSVVRLGRGGTKTPSDTSQTERWGIRRAEEAQKRIARIDQKLLELRRWRNGIRAARQTLTEDAQQFVWLKYDLEKSHNETRDALRQKMVNLSESTYYRFRKQVIEDIQNFMEGLK
jgi:hypothetical protein